MGHSTRNRQSIRRSRPNSLKLSGFVENFSLIILIINFSRKNSFFAKIEVEYKKGTFSKKIWFFSKKRRKFPFLYSNFKTNHIFRFLVKSCIRIYRNQTTFKETFMIQSIHQKKHCLKNFLKKLRWIRILALPVRYRKFFSTRCTTFSRPHFKFRKQKVSKIL